MLKEKALEIAKLNKQITDLLDEINKERSTYRFYKSCDDCFHWGSKQDVEDTAAALGIEAVTKDFDSVKYPTRTSFMFEGAEFFSLNSKEESEVVK